MIPAAPPIDIRDDIKITVGTVKATEVRASGGTIERGATHANLHMGHVVWLEDGDGKEHPFEGGAFSDAREGHKISVVQKRSSGKIIRVHNQATRSTVDLNDLKPMSSDPSDLFWNAVALTFLLFIPGIVTAITISGGIRDTLGITAMPNYGTHVMVVLLVLVPASRWLMGKLAIRSQAKVKILSDYLDELFAKHGLNA